MEPDVDSSHIVTVHHPFFMGRKQQRGYCAAPREQQQLVPITVQVSRPPGTAVPSQSAADPPAARATFSNHDAAEHLAPDIPKINVQITSTNCSTTNLSEWHNFRDESESACLQSQTDVT